MIATIALPLATSVNAGKAAPIVKWAGGKRSLVPHLLRLAPQRFSTFYEPFLGGGSFFLALAPPRAALNDANHDLMEVYRAVRDDPDGVITALDEMQPRVLDAEFFYHIRATPAAELPIQERAARFIFLNKTCYNGLYRVNRAGQFNVPFGRYARPPGLYDRANVWRVSELLKRTELWCGDFETALEGGGRGDFVYVDPPYVPLTATASFTRYTRGNFTAIDQRRLADAVHELTRRGCRTLISNSDTPLVRELYEGYPTEVLQAPRNINSDAAGRSRISELAIRNYDDDGVCVRSMGPAG